MIACQSNTYWVAFRSRQCSFGVIFDVIFTHFGHFLWLEDPLCDLETHPLVLKSQSEKLMKIEWFILGVTAIVFPRHDVGVRDNHQGGQHGQQGRHWTEIEMPCPSATVGPTMSSPLATSAALVSIAAIQTFTRSLSR